MPEIINPLEWCLYGRMNKQIELGFMDNGTGKHQSNTVYSTGGVSPCISTLIKGGTQQIKVLVMEETRIVKIGSLEPDREFQDSVTVYGGWGYKSCHKSKKL